MAIDVLQTLEVIEAMENFVARIRPAENIRHKVDINYKIDGQSILLFEIRPRWDNTGELMECPIAKTSFVKAKQHWKVFWMRADLKWHSYAPVPIVKTVKEFILLVEEDKHHCFWG